MSMSPLPLTHDHTPGPWSLMDISDGEDEMFRISGESTLHLTVAPCADGYVPGQNEANAHLIAACPDLFDACIAGLAALIRLNSVHHCRDAAIVAASMRNTINKAKGRN